MLSNARFKAAVNPSEEIRTLTARTGPVPWSQIQLLRLTRALCGAACDVLSPSEPNFATAAHSARSPSPDTSHRRTHRTPRIYRLQRTLAGWWRNTAVSVSPTLAHTHPSTHTFSVFCLHWHQLIRAELARAQRLYAFQNKSTNRYFKRRVKAKRGDVEVTRPFNHYQKSKLVKLQSL